MMILKMFFNETSEKSVKYSECDFGDGQFDFLHSKRIESVRKSPLFKDFRLTCCTQQAGKTKVVPKKSSFMPLLINS